MMNRILIWIYLKLTDLLKKYPALEYRDELDFVSISSGPLTNLSFLVRFADEGEKLAYNYQIVVVPKNLKEFVDKNFDLVDAYVGNVINSTLNNILNRV
jgi:hypothetical protein